MKIDVQKNHLGGQILYKSLGPAKKWRHCRFVADIQIFTKRKIRDV